MKTYRSADALLPVRFRFLGLDNGPALPENAGQRSGGVGEALEDEEAPEVRVAGSLLFVVGAVLVVAVAKTSKTTLSLDRNRRRWGGGGFVGGMEDGETGEG